MLTSQPAPVVAPASVPTFDQLDRNGDGVITRAEFVQSMTAPASRAPPATPAPQLAPAQVQIDPAIMQEVTRRVLAQLVQTKPNGRYSREEFEEALRIELFRLGYVYQKPPPQQPAAVFIDRQVGPPVVNATIQQAPPIFQQQVMVPVQVIQPVTERLVRGPPRIQYVDKIIYEAEPPPQVKLPTPEVHVKQVVEKFDWDFPYHDFCYGTSWRYHHPDSLDEQLLGMDLGKHKLMPLEQLRHAAFMRMVEQQWAQEKLRTREGFGAAGGAAGAYQGAGSGGQWGARRVREPPMLDASYQQPVQEIEL